MRARQLPPLLTLLLAAGVANAQPGPPVGRFDIDSLAILLDLDAYQKDEVARVLDEQRAAIEAARTERDSADDRPSFEERRARHAALEQETLAKLANVLTENQITKLELLLEPPRAGMRRRGDRDAL